MASTGWQNADAQRLDEICGRFGIGALYVFGSAARGEDDATSDLDLLYELRSGARLGWEIADLTDELSELFGRPVDLVPRRAINPRLREVILHDARPVYAA